MGNDAWNKIHHVCMEIWNSKSNGNIYFDFEATFKVYSKVHFGQAIYCVQSSRSQESNASNSAQIRAKKRKVWAFEANQLDRKVEFKIVKLNSKCF